MTCNNCVRHVTEAIQGVPGVGSASVKLESGLASVRWKPDSPENVPAVLAAVKAAGYEAMPAESKDATCGCNSCATHDARSGWHLNLWLGGVVTATLMCGEWIFNLGMTRWFQWLSFALAGAVQCFAGAQFYRGAWRQLKAGRSNMDTLVALGSTTAFGYSVWALFTGRGGHLYFMEAAAIITLISVGHWIEARVSSRAESALKSLLQLSPKTARRLGAAANAPVGEKARSSFDLLTTSFKPTAGRTPTATGGDRVSSLFDPAHETEVPVSQLRTGDLVSLRPGDHVPTDGEVVEGHSTVDESMLTGESVPVDKSPGTKLYAGTLNANSRLVMRVTATGESTALAHIIAAVQRAQTSRAGIQRLGDRVSSVFVPVVAVIALTAGLWWGLAPESAKRVHDVLSPLLWHAHPPTGIAAGFIIAAAVLIVACPCAMGLATPAAIMAGANAAARRGILIRDGVALEKAGTITTIVFDKTGTLTVGKPVVAATWNAERSGDKNAAIAATLTRHSSHPISQAVMAFVTATLESADSPERTNGRVLTNAATAEDWTEIRGAGVRAKVRTEDGNWTPASLGSIAWLRECGVNLTDGERFVTDWSSKGATIVGLATDNMLAGLFAVKDTLKPGAAKVVGQLQRQGLKTCLLTGDNRLTAAGIAEQCGIPAENVMAEVRPEQKAEFVKRLQQQGGRVAFVGDGINDAPALEQADLGIAVSRASDVAREAADIILLKSEIEAVPEALGLARATLRTIKQNLFWAFFYNAAGVPLAALGFMSPILCAAAMGLSDLIVIGNALRLRGWRLD